MLSIPPKQKIYLLENVINRSQNYNYLHLIIMSFQIFFIFNTIDYFFSYYYNGDNQFMD